MSLTQENENFKIGGAGQTTVTVTTGKNGDSVTAGTGLLLRTVTAGTTFFLTHFSISMNTTNNFELRDNNIGGTLKAAGQSTANRSLIYHFNPPIQFSTNIFLDVANNDTNRWMLNGFEE